MVGLALKKSLRPGAVAHTCNPSILEVKAGGSPEVRSLRPSWATWQNLISTKKTIQKLAWPGGVHMPLAPPTWEAEVGGLLEP